MGSLALLFLKDHWLAIAKIGVLLGSVWWVYDLGRDHQATECEAARIEAIQAQKDQFQAALEEAQRNARARQAQAELWQQEAERYEKEMAERGLSCPVPDDLSKRLRSIQ